MQLICMFANCLGATCFDIMHQVISVCMHKKGIYFKALILVKGKNANKCKITHKREQDVHNICKNPE